VIQAKGFLSILPQTYLIKKYVQCPNGRDAIFLMCVKMRKIFVSIFIKGLFLSELAASGLTCIKRDRVLFSDLSMTITSGQLIYLRGPNGAGKTSLLRILTGLSEPAAGQVTFNGQDCSRVLSTFHQQLIYIGHKPGLSDSFSAIENLQFWALQQCLVLKAGLITDVLEKLGLVGLEDVPVRYLSAGQQRRVALSRLWLKPASIWILDEPFTALDTDGIQLLETLFKAHVAQGGALLTTSHQPLSAAAGPVEEFYLEYQI
jgi:heme exporter protein A